MKKENCVQKIVIIWKKFIEFQTFIKKIYQTRPVRPVNVNMNETRKNLATQTNKSQVQGIDFFHNSARNSVKN